MALTKKSAFIRNAYVEKIIGYVALQGYRRSLVNLLGHDQTLVSRTLQITGDNMSKTTNASSQNGRNSTIESFQTHVEVDCYDGTLHAGSNVDNFGMYAEVSGQVSVGDDIRDVRLTVGYAVANWIIRQGVKRKKTVGAARFSEIYATTVQAPLPGTEHTLLTRSLILREGVRYSVNAIVKGADGQLTSVSRVLDRADGESLIKATKAKQSRPRPKAEMGFLGVDRG